MKISKSSNFLLTAMLVLATGPASAMIVAESQDADALARLLSGPGVTISNARLSSDEWSGAGIFSGAANAIGFDSGVLLTTGTIDCAPGPNTKVACQGQGARTSLKFDFTSTSGKIFFNYVFASEEYNEFVGSQYNDSFMLLLNGVNIALLPGRGGAVTINNINNFSNASFFRDNTVLGLDTDYNGLTTVLTASANLQSGVNHFEFIIENIGDKARDSGVFLEKNTFSSTASGHVPEPATIAMMGLGLFGLTVARKRKRKK